MAEFTANSVFAVQFVLKATNLARIAGEAATPLTMDEITTMSSVESFGNQLHRTYIVDADGLTLSDSFADGIASNLCLDSFFGSAIRQGVQINEIYVETGGRRIREIIVNRISNAGCLRHCLCGKSAARSGHRDLAIVKTCD